MNGSVGVSAGMGLDVEMLWRLFRGLVAPVLLAMLLAMLLALSFRTVPSLLVPSATVARNVGVAV